MDRAKDKVYLDLDNAEWDKRPVGESIQRQQYLPPCRRQPVQYLPLRCGFRRQLLVLFPYYGLPGLRVRRVLQFPLCTRRGQPPLQRAFHPSRHGINVKNEKRQASSEGEKNYTMQLIATTRLGIHFKNWRPGKQCSF